MEPPVLLAGEASVDANSGRALVPASGSVTVRQKTVTSGDLAVYLQFIFMDRSAYIWAGLDGEFGNLAVAIPPKFVSWLHSRSCCTLFVRWLHSRSCCTLFAWGPQNCLALVAPWPHADWLHAFWCCLHVI